MFEGGGDCDDDADGACGGVQYGVGGDGEVGDSECEKGCARVGGGRTGDCDGVGGGGDGVVDGSCVCLCIRRVVWPVR